MSTNNTIDLDRDVILTNRQAANLLRCHISTVFRWEQRGELPFTKHRGRRVVRRCDREALLVPGEPRQRPAAEAEPSRRQMARETRETLLRAGLIR
jgi:excisionase family DNA binding protein